MKMQPPAEVQWPAMGARDEYLRILRSPTPEQKLRTATRLYCSARRLKAAALHAQHPDWSEIERAVREIFLYARS